MMGLTRFHRTTGRAAVLLAVICIALPASVRADKIYYKNGKFIQGIIQEEYPTRVELLFEGRLLSIPRTRIDRIEYETREENLQSMLAKVADALRREEPAEARKHIEAARELDRSGQFAAELNDYEQEVIQLETHGTAEQRRAEAERLLQQARDQIDRIQIDAGLEYLLQALETDPTLRPAHDLMARQLREMIPPPVDLAIDYFSDFVALDEMKANHPFVSFAPAALVELRKRHADAETEERILETTRRIRKVTRLFEEHPDWSYEASGAQMSVVNRGFDGVIEAQIEDDLDDGDFETALYRIRAWEEIDADAPQLPRFFVRAWIGLGDFEQAKNAMAQMIDGPAPPEWAKLSQNALTNYETALDALKWGQDRQAEGLLATLLSLKGQLLPEVYQLIARTKFKYDEPKITQLTQQGDPSGAADVALRAFVYSVNPEHIVEARNSFTDLAPAISFKPSFVWNLDGIDIPLRDVSLDIIKTKFGSEYGLRFSDISPFAMEIRIDNFTYNGTGEDLLAQIDNENAYTVDIYQSDDTVVEMEIHITVSHPVAPELFTVDIVQPDLPDGASYGREDEVYGTVYFDLLQHSSIENFLEDDFLKYLPERMNDVYGELDLPEKSED